MSAEERTGWRCQEISERHRSWGYNCPAVDLDFVVAEYNHGKPVALVEYKHKRAFVQLQHPTYRALEDLANRYDRGPLPFLVAVYDPDTWSFKVIPINEAAKDHYRHVMDSAITEQRFVRSLYLLRKDVLSSSDEAAISQLNSELPAGLERQEAATSG